MASSKPDMYNKEIKSQFRTFFYKLSSKLVDCVEKKQNGHNSSPQLNIISQAVLTLSYIFRVKYRHAYFSVRNSILEREKFMVFCKNTFEYDNLPYFFTFLLNISLKFEMFLYLRHDGKNYYSVLAHSLGDYPDYLHFELGGGIEKLSCISSIFLDLTKDLQILVKFENPLVPKLPLFEECIYEIEKNHTKPFCDKSFVLLKAISSDLYKGLEKYRSERVLPFIILRFLLDGNVPDRADNDDKLSALANDNRASIVRYFSRCLVSEILSGVVYEGKNRLQLRLALGINDDYLEKANFDSNSENESEKQNFNFEEWLPILNSLPEDGLFMGINNDADSVCKTDNKSNKKRVSKEFNSKRENSETKILSKEKLHSSEGKSYGSGLEWLKCFDSKNVSLFNTNNFQVSQKGYFTKNSSSESVHKSNQSVARRSIRQNLAAIRKEFEIFDNSISCKKQQKNPPSEANCVSESKKRNRKKKKKKLKRVEKSSSDDLPFNSENMSDPLRKLKDNLILAINQTKNLRSWEKKCIIFFMDKAEEFSTQEKFAICKMIEAIPGIQIDDNTDIMQMVDLVDLDAKSDLLYSDDKNESEQTSKIMPFPECTGNVRDEFIELMFRILAISCDKIIQTAILGEWVPFLQNILERDESLLPQMANSGPNDFLQLLCDHASKEDSSQSPH